MDKRITGRTICKSLLAAIFIGFSVYLMMFRSALKWTFEQKEYWFAAGELCIVFVILAYILHNTSHNIRLCLCASGCTILVFCYLHAYFYAFLIGSIYMVFLYLLGRTIGQCMGLRDVQNASGLFNIVFGMAGEMLIVSALSLVKMGTSHQVRIAFIILFAALLLLDRKYIRTLGHRIANIRLQNNNRKIYSILVAAIITMVLLQIGRANISLDYDSVWYGLRSEYMLAPYGGIYDKVTSAGLVYTYGKGIETVCLPFAGLTSYGFIYSVNIFFAIGILVCIFKICRSYVSTTKSLYAVLAVSVTPGVMNMAVTAKSDIATTFLELVAVYAAVRAIRHEDELFGVAIGACMK